MLKPRGKLFLIFWLQLLSTIPQIVIASHMIAVEIRAKPLDCNSRLYEITLIGYVNTASSVAFGGEEDVLLFGDGGGVIVPGQVPIVIDPLLNIGRVQYRVVHTYSSAGKYILSYREYARNAGIVNMDESEFTTFYTETGITIGNGYCDSSPYLTVPPVDRACTGTSYYHNPGAVDPNDDSISFEFAIPKSNLSTNVKNYRYPNDRQFYSSAGIDYSTGNEDHDGPPTFVIDPVSRTLTWDAPGAVGEYALAIKVTAWKFNSIDSIWVESGFSIRDMQVVVEQCSNQKPALIVPADLCVIAGTTVEFIIPASDPDDDPVIIESFSDVFSLEDSPAKVVPGGPVLQSTASPYDTAAVHFKWATSCLHVKNQPYKIVFKVTDSPPSGPKLVRFETVSIRVIAPAPEYETVTINPINRNVTLTWKEYDCENVQNIQVWRRVSQYNYQQPECSTGMPYFLRYALLTTLPGDSQQYVDSGLSIGAQYCYRIVALIGDNKLPSRISFDTCFIPKPAEAPIITNVSVTETSEIDGGIQIRWTSPFDIDKNQYPAPYEYKVFRSQGFGQNTFVEVTSTPIADTAFIDKQINTRDFPHEYQVILFVPTLVNTPIDTSSIASSVFLKAEPQPGKIKLVWQAYTPWYNYVQAYPYHRIYRSSNGPSGPFHLIDSVDVNENGFQYIDNGKFQNTALVENQLYYYKVLTRGAYGNPEVIEPLENFSQIAGSTILDAKPPCTPIVVLEKTDCSTFECSADSYYNKITWSYPDDAACLEASLTYRIFVADTEDGEFLPLATVTGNSFQHNNLNSLAKCYAVAAIDAVGNISSMSEPVCNDNCPYFELPNVFTPGSPDGWNDQLVAFGSETGTSRCARFVKQVDLKVYNRWGMEVYSVVDIVGESNYIFWDGSSNTGREVEDGVYFYSADVTFDVRDPSEQRKIIKGWIHVIRNH